MISQLIQRQVQINQSVTFRLKTGQEITGVLVEIGRDHVTVERNGQPTTLLTDVIGGWEVLTGAEQAINEQETRVNDLAPEPPETPVIASIGTAAPIAPDTIPQSILTKVLRIEALYDARLATAKPTMHAPVFGQLNDEIKGAKTAEATKLWWRIANKYQYSEKVNETHPKFGRLQPIINELKTLLNWYPTSSFVRRHLAYCTWLSGDVQEALNLYRQAALAAGEPDDWFHTAILSTQTNTELACFSYEQYFRHGPIDQDADAWYAYLALVRRHSSYSSMKEWVNSRLDELSEQALQLLFETALYLLWKNGQTEIVVSLDNQWQTSNRPKDVIKDAYKKLEGKPSDSFLQLATELTTESVETAKVPSPQLSPMPSEGSIYSYQSDRNFGFLRTKNSERFFFHRSAIIDDELLVRLTQLGSSPHIDVVFNMAQGPKGPLAVDVSLPHTVDDLYQIAVRNANDGDYPKALGQVKRVLAVQPKHAEASKSLEQWRDFARAVAVPRGSNPYARGKRLQIVEKDLERAADMYRQAIRQGDNVESAIKDLAAVLGQLDRPTEAIELLMSSRSKITDQQPVDNLLIDFYQNVGQHDKAVQLLERRFEQSTNPSAKAHFSYGIGLSYMRQEDYVKAEASFRQTLKFRVGNKAAHRNLAVCLFRQGRYDEAETLLNQILDTSPDAQSAQLLEAVARAKSTGQIEPIDKIIIETTLSDFSREISGLTQFLLDRCKFEGVPPERVQSGDLRRSDVRKLEDIATQLGTKSPRVRASYYISAAKILSQLQDDDSPSQFYKCLGRSYASRGDATILESGPLDTAREYYCEALAAYDNDRSIKGDEQDASNALVRFLFSTLGHSAIPIRTSFPTIDETLESIFSQAPQRSRVFDAIGHLIYRSNFAANRVLNKLYAKSTLQATALQYLNEKGLHAAHPIRQLDGFVQIWNELRRKLFEEQRVLSAEFRFLRRIELSSAWLENGIVRLKGITHLLFFDLDQQRARQMQLALEAMLDLTQQNTFEEQERLCFQVDARCQDLLREIEVNPTRLSVEELYPVVAAIRTKVAARLEELYEISVPQLVLRLPVESYTPDGNQQLDIQVVVANRLGCSPAESLELIVPVQDDDESFVLVRPETKLDGSLRGGDQRILTIPMRVTDKAIEAQAFSLPVYAQYSTRTGERPLTEVTNFSVRLYSQDEFDEIDNPYSAYAEGGVVSSPSMFFGRAELLQSVANAIQQAGRFSKCVVIFGQKRAGKSSILFHLEALLQQEQDTLVLNVGNIGSILDPHSSVPLLYQILWSIISRLKYAIEDWTDQGRAKLAVNFPSDLDFFNHPSPLQLFKSIFEMFLRSAARSEDWQNVKTILLVDEFSYIYDQIVTGNVPELFMKNWKALLQENYFSAVLVGQDVMAKFKKRFPNEFGTTQDERVSYLRPDDAIHLIEDPTRIGGLMGESRFRERAVERILDLSAGSPFYIQIICNRLVEHMNRRHARLVTDADVEQVKDDLIRGVNALGSDKFENLVNSGDTSDDAISNEDALAVLTEIASNSRTGSASRNTINCETQQPLDLILDDLTTREVIERRDHYYRIRVALFKEWLVAHR